MAGSYKHIVDKDNKFIGIDLIDNLGDACEALEECYWLINYLSLGNKTIIFNAHKAYVASPSGCNNPNYAANMKEEDYWSDE